MNKIYVLFIQQILILLSLCTTFTATGQILPGVSRVEPSSITTLPLKAHSGGVDVFFNSERPKEPFYKIGIVEVDAVIGTSMDKMLAALKTKAAEKGLDGLMMGDLSKNAFNIFIYGAIDNVASYQKMAGIGILYPGRMDYVDTILKEQSVTLWTDDNRDPKLFTMKFDFYGTNTTQDDLFVDRFFDEQVYPFEDARTLYSTFGSWDVGFNASGNTFLKTNEAALFDGFTCSFYYNKGRLLKGEIVERGSKRAKWLLLPVYSEGRLIGKRLMDGKDLVWEESIFYRLNGMPDKIQRTKIVDGKRVPIFEIKNSYYSKDDLPPVKQ